MIPGKIQRIKELNNLLLDASNAYYVLDNPIMSDKQYDELYDELTKLEKEQNFYLTNSVTQKVQGKILSGFNEVKHSRPMLSCYKTKDIEEIKKFLSNNQFYASRKLDGLTLVVMYDKGKFIKAVTRGDGIMGEDVTESAKMISNLPKNINYPGYMEIRGECVISWDQFNKINSSLEVPYSHPRNLAGGTLRQLDTSITRARKLSFIAYNLISNNNIPSKIATLSYLDQLGFDTVERCVADVDTCIQRLNAESSVYPVDGIVFEFDSLALSLSVGSTEHHDNCRIAYKWEDQTYKTKIKDIEWQVGKTGVITPVAVFEPVDLDGALTSKATLHNLGIFEELRLGYGDIVTVYRANKVIPQIDKNLTQSNSYDFPRNCPCCGEPTEVKITNKTKLLICTNENCPERKLNQFTHFVSREGVDIEGLSEKTLEQLISRGYIKKFKDLYHLTKEQLLTLEGFKDKSAENILASIENSRKVKLEKYLSAISIPNIGKGNAKTISKLFHGNYDSFTKACEEKTLFSNIPGFGEVLNNSIYSWFNTTEKLDEDLASEFTFAQEPIDSEIKNTALKGMRFCITGSFTESRENLKKRLENGGAIFVGNVSKNLDVLFAGEKAGSKLEKASALGIKIVCADELFKMLEDNGL